MLHQQITEDLRTAMKAGQEFELGVLRMLSAALHNKEIEKKGKGLEIELSDDEAVEILTREAKKRKEASELYVKGNRNDLAEKETKELEFIKKYLPAQMAQEEIEKIVKAAIEKTGSREVKDFGKVMAEAMKNLKGKADAGAVSEIVKKLLTLNL